MPYKHHEAHRDKFDKAKYRVTNWADYDQSLKKRGSLTLWFTDEAIEAWKPKPKMKSSGGQQHYSDLAIETALTLRSVYHLAFRQTEGFLESIISLLGLNLSIPDHTTLSRRSQTLSLPKLKRTPGQPVCLLVDSTGVKISGTGEWQEMKHGKKRRSWNKLHLAIDEKTGDILASKLTKHTEDDAAQVPDLLVQIDEDIESMKADGAYDKHWLYDELERQTIKGIFPPIKDAALSSRAKTDPTQRDQHILMIEKLGKMGWQKETNFGQRSLVENAMFRYKTIIGSSIRAREDSARKTEVQIGISILNRITQEGMPVSIRV